MACLFATGCSTYCSRGSSSYSRTREYLLWTRGPHSRQCNSEVRLSSHSHSTWIRVLVARVNRLPCWTKYYWKEGYAAGTGCERRRAEGPGECNLVRGNTTQGRAQPHGAIASHINNAQCGAAYRHHLRSVCESADGNRQAGDNGPTCDHLQLAKVGSPMLQSGC